jgi:hypothetical protein
VLQKFYISELFFTKEELKSFFERYGYNITEIYYSSISKIDFSKQDEKEFLFKEGISRILARFYAF